MKRQEVLNDLLWRLLERYLIAPTPPEDEEPDDGLGEARIGRVNRHAFEVILEDDGLHRQSNKETGGKVMADWQHVLRISDLWKAREAGTIDLDALAHGIAARIKRLSAYNESETLRHIAEQFEDFSETQDGTGDTVEDFDSIMEELYDWGDSPLNSDWPRKRLCRIDTMGVN